MEIYGKRTVFVESSLAVTSSVAMLLIIKFNNRNPVTLQHYQQHKVIC